MDALLYERLDDDGHLIRRFSDERIQSAIDEAMSHIDADTPVATVAHLVVDGSGRASAKVSIATRFGDSVTIQAAAFADWGGGSAADLGAAAKIVWTPKF